jgi:ribonucleotide reductase alpha subunit
MNQGVLDTLRNKYFKRDEEGNLIESTPDQMLHRVAKAVASVEQTIEERAYWEREFFLMMSGMEFLPNSPTLMNAGTDIKSLAACFLLDINDSREAISKTLGDAMEVFAFGGGVGFPFSKIRPKGDLVKSTRGRASGPVSFAGIYDAMTETIMQGGKRRGASMGTLVVHHPDILEFIQVKRDKSKLNNFNLSVLLTDEFMEAVERGLTEFWAKDPKTGERRGFNLQDGTTGPINPSELMDVLVTAAWTDGEPGVYFIDNAERGNPFPYEVEYMRIAGPNPCITGETLVAVADGRSFVSMKQLAEERNDVPVYSLKPKGGLTVRKMLNPRKTGTNVKILKITLDDGNVVRCSANHKLLTSSREYVEAKNITPGTSLYIATKRQMTIKDMFPEANSKSSLYYAWQKSGSQNCILDHRLIYTYHKGSVLRGEVIHHNDNHSLNNNPDNLVSMAKKEHDLHHSEWMRGDNNPIHKMTAEGKNPLKGGLYSMGAANHKAIDIASEKILSSAVEFCLALGRRFSEKEWIEYAKGKGLPTNFTSWRQKELGIASNKELGVKAAKIALVISLDYDTRVLSTFLKAQKQGYESELQDGVVTVKRICEGCGATFWINYQQRERSFCSASCSNKYVNSNQDILDKRAVGVNKTYRQKGKETKTLQASAYTSLALDLGRTPLESEWKEVCKISSIPHRIGTKHGFKTFTQLKEDAKYFNHRVISIEDDGFEDVYNGTVEETHNFFVGGWESLDTQGRTQWTVLNNKQCGEAVLRPYESCVLGSINLTKFISPVHTFDLESLRATVGKAVRFLDNIIEISVPPLEEIQNATRETRKIGLGVMGLHDALLMMEFPYSISKSSETKLLVEGIFSTIKQAAIKASEELAKERGTYSAWECSKAKISGERPRRNACLLSIAPTGTIARIADVSFGIEPVLYYQTHNELVDVQYDSTHVLAKQFLEHGEELPVYFEEALEISPDDHLAMQILVQSYVDQAVSKTILLPNSCKKSEVEGLFMKAWNSGLKGFTIYRDGSRANQPISSAKEATPVNTVADPLQHTHRERTTVMYGPSYKVKTPEGNVYIDLHHNSSEEVCEIMLQLGDGFTDTEKGLANWAARLLSKTLQHGVDYSEVVKQGASTEFEHKSRAYPGRVFWFGTNGKQKAYRSIPEVVSDLMVQQVNKLASIEDENVLDSEEIIVPLRGDRPVCEKCGGQLEYDGGCWACKCGFSRCS